MHKTRKTYPLALFFYFLIIFLIPNVVTAVGISFTAQPVVVWTSPSSVAASFTTSSAVSVVGECGTQSGGPYSSAVTPALYTEGYQRTDFTGTSQNWGHAIAIPGLQQKTEYYCKIIATDASGSSVSSKEFSARTASLQTTPMAVASMSKLTRTNDYYSGANGLPALHYWNDGDTQYQTWAENGNVYGTCHDCGGESDAYKQEVAWYTRDSAMTHMSQIGGQLGFGSMGGPANSGTACAGKQFESWGMLSVNGVLYLPVDCDDMHSASGYNILKSYDHLANSINASDAYNKGPNAPASPNADVPTAGEGMPNVPSTSAGQVQPFWGMISNGCQDQTINCTPEGNNDAFVYDFGYQYSNGAIKAFLTRIRREDLPLGDGSKWQCYKGTRTSEGDDGLYDSAWTSNFSQCNFNWPEENLASTSMTFIPSFGRWLLLFNHDNYSGKGTFLADQGPYPWNLSAANPTLYSGEGFIGTITWNSRIVSARNLAFGQVVPNSQKVLSSSPLSTSIIVSTTGTQYTHTDSPYTDNYSMFLTTVNLVSAISQPAPVNPAPAPEPAPTPVPQPVSPVCASNWVCSGFFGAPCVANSASAGGGIQTQFCYDSNRCPTPTTSTEPSLSQPCCYPNWQTGNWSNCANGTQTRTVTDKNNCGVLENKPAISQPCCSSNWICSGFGPCDNGIQTQTCYDSNGCLTPTISTKPSLTESCDVPVTSKNQTPSPSVPISQPISPPVASTPAYPIPATATQKFQPFKTDLHFGMIDNSEVRRLQDFLIGIGYLPQGRDSGNYLALTDAAVKSYQQANGITPVSGYFGPKTRAKVNAFISGS